MTQLITLVRLSLMLSFMVVFTVENMFSFADPYDPLNKNIPAPALRGNLPVPKLIPLQRLIAQKREYDDFSESNLNKIINAIRYGNLRAIKDICTNSPWVVNEFDDTGNLPLHHAVQSNYKYALIMVKALVEIDPDPITVENSDGDTPLCLAHRKDVLNYLKKAISNSSSQEDSAEEEQSEDDQEDDQDNASGLSSDDAVAVSDYDDAYGYSDNCSEDDGE